MSSSVKPEVVSLGRHARLRSISRAIAALLETLALTGCIVTIDAIGRQRAIASQLVGRPAPSLLRRGRTAMVGIGAKRLSCCWHEFYLLTVLAT